MKRTKLHTKGGSPLSSLIFWNFTLLHISLNSFINLHFSYKISLLRKQHNPWHNTKNYSNSSYNLIYLLCLTFILSISHFHIFYKHIPHKIPIHTPHISLNSMPHIVYIYKIHVQQSICKVEFNQPSCWLYSVPNLFVFQQLVTLYLGGILVKVVSKIV